MALLIVMVDFGTQYAERFEAADRTRVVHEPRQYELWLSVLHLILLPLKRCNLRLSVLRRSQEGVILNCHRRGGSNNGAPL